MATAAETADNAIAQYDAFIFASVGRPAGDVLPHADLLALSAALECDVAARDTHLPKSFREQYRATAAALRRVAG